MSVDRSTLDTITKSVDDYIDSFCDQIKHLIPHSFIAKQQSLFQTDAMSSLLLQQLVVIGDFSENYTFVLQDAAQGFHWNISQATIIHLLHTTENQESWNMSVILLYLIVCIMTQLLCIYFRTIWYNPFKKNFQNSTKYLIFQMDPQLSTEIEKPYESFLSQRRRWVQAEFHFYATSCGKGPCDGISGTVKHLATKASLQRACHSQIMTPRQLFDWAVEKQKGYTLNTAHQMTTDKKRSQKTKNKQNYTWYTETSLLYSSKQC